MSPQNRATGTTSRKPAETNREVAAKLAADSVATSIRLIRPPPRPPPPSSPSGVPPIAKATIRMKGRAARIPPMSRVRRRRSCRMASTRRGSVRPAR